MILSLEACIAQKKFWSPRQIVVWTNGCFDLLHPGHIRSLLVARSLGDILVVGVNDDAAVRYWKGHDRPLCTQQERLEMVASLRAVTVAVAMTDHFSDRCIRALRPDIFCKGAEFGPQGDHRLPDRELAAAQECGAEIVYLPQCGDWSTTKLIDRIQRQVVHEKS